MLKRTTFFGACLLTFNVKCLLMLIVTKIVLNKQFNQEALVNDLAKNYSSYQTYAVHINKKKNQLFGYQ